MSAIIINEEKFPNPTSSTVQQITHDLEIENRSYQGFFSEVLSGAWLALADSLGIDELGLLFTSKIFTIYSVVMVYFLLSTSLDLELPRRHTSGCVCEHIFREI